MRALDVCSGGLSRARLSEFYVGQAPAALIIGTSCICKSGYFNPGYFNPGTLISLQPRSDVIATVLLNYHTTHSGSPSYFFSKLYRSHSARAFRLASLTDSSGSAINSMILVFNPSFSNCGLFSGTSLTRHPTSLHAMVRTCLSLSQGFDMISASFFGSSPFSCSRIRRAFSAQNVVLLCGGDHRR